MGTIHPIVMPKWGLAMQEGMVARWDVGEGDTVELGQEFMDIETTKIANAFESPVAGTLRRKVVGDGETVPVGALIGVVTEGDVPDDEIDAFVTRFQEEFVPPEEGEDEGPEPEFADIGNGRRIRYMPAGPDDGGADPVVFIHGFGGDYLSWMFNQAEAAQDRAAYAIDLAGHGGSTKDPGAGDVPALAADVVAFMDAAGIEAAYLVGHSLGGAIALQIAATVPDRVKGLVLIAPAGLGPEINMEFIEGFLTQKRARKLRGVLEMLVADPALITAEMTEQVLRLKRLDGAEEALRTIAGACFEGGKQSGSVRGVLDGLSVPVAVVWGHDDRILPVAHADGLPGSVAVTVLDETGHVPHMERSARVNEIVAGIVRS